MALSLKPEHVKRYTDIARLLITHGRSDLVQGDRRRAGGRAARGGGGGDPEQLARDLEALGPTFIKLGQLLSTRSDLLPAPYLDALARLQDRVEPFPFEQVETIVASEIGARISKAFLDFDHVAARRGLAGAGPPGACCATGGRWRSRCSAPDIRQVIVEDLEAFYEIAAWSTAHRDRPPLRLPDMLERVPQDPAARARLPARGGQPGHPGPQPARLPAAGDPAAGRRLHDLPGADHGLRRGQKITDLSPLARIDLDGQELAEELCQAYLDQILIDGFFHADPHPGNLLITDDGRLALLDLGMVARIDPALQEQLLKLLLAVSSGQGQEAAQVTLRIGTPLVEHDEARYRREVADLVGSYQSVAGGRAQVGRTMIGLARLAAENGVRPAPELTMMGAPCSSSTTRPAPSIPTSIPTSWSAGRATRSCAATC